MPENNGNPQLENGYVRIANELYEALARIRIPGEAEQVLKVIIRRTYGFNKKQDWISLGQFMAATGLIKSHVQRALRRLVKMKMVTKKGSPYKPTYGLQKVYGLWQREPKKVTGNQIGCHKVTQKGAIREPNRVTTKDTLTKDTPTKDIRTLSGKPDDVPYQEIIADLNQAIGAKYDHNTPATRIKIKTLWKAGRRLEDFRHVHRVKAADWLGTDQAKYLRPETLYGSKFEGYLNQEIQVKASDLGLSEKGLETAKALARTGERVRRGEI